MNFFLKYTTLKLDTLCFILGIVHVYLEAQQAVMSTCWLVGWMVIGRLVII